MRQVRTWEQFEKILKKEIQVNLEQIGKEIAGVLKKYVNDNWYKNSNPESYQRTYDILNSITVSKVKHMSDGYEVSIYFDETKIRMIEYEGLFNAHLSIDGSGMYQGMSIPQWVVYWMNYGQNSPKYSYEGAGFLEDTIKWTEDDKYHINRMCELLEGKGFRCSIG
jgi:hypothetical protein